MTVLRAGNASELCAGAHVAADVMGVTPSTVGALESPPASGRQSQLPAAPGPPGALQPATAAMMTPNAAAGPNTRDTRRSRSAGESVMTLVRRHVVEEHLKRAIAEGLGDHQPDRHRLRPRRRRD